MSFQPRPYQTEAVSRAVDFFSSDRPGNGLEILPTGSGKSVVIANIASNISGKTVVFQPSKEILEQNYRKYTSYGYRAGIYSASAGAKHLGEVTFATIGSVIRKKHIFREFSNIIIDECFPAGTLVDGVAIDCLQVGSLVSSYNHQTGKVEKRPIVRLFKKKYSGTLLLVTLSDKTCFVCTEEHPIFIQHVGYLPAKDVLLRINEVLNALKIRKYEQEDNAVLHCVRERREEVKPCEKCEGVLRGKLQGGTPISASEEGADNMYSLRKEADANWDAEKKLPSYRSGLLFGRVLDARETYCFQGEGGGMPERQRVEEPCFSKNEGEQPYVDGRGERKDDRSLKGENLSEPWGQWQIDETANDASSGNGATYGVPDSNGGSQTPVPVCTELLQSRFGRPRTETCHRGRRTVPPPKKMEVFGCSEDFHTECVRVESVTLYKRGGGCRCEEVCTCDYVYNIEVEHNHNYFVEGTLVHNCHLVNPEGGMYHDFIKSHDHMKVLGLTATPYRLSSTMEGSMLKFLTRTKPRIFDRILYSVQNKVLFDAGFLAPLEYFSFDVVDRRMLMVNSNGSDFDQRSLRQYYQKINMPQQTAYWATRLLAKRKNLLIFCSLLEEAYQTAHLIDGAVVLTGDTPKPERERILAAFTSGKIRCLVNVGVLTTGFDYPELECVLLARSTMSLALYYQMIGRVMRPHPGKQSGWVVDLGGNLAMFGKIETMRLEWDRNSKPIITNGGRQLTNILFSKT